MASKDQKGRYKLWLIVPVVLLIISAGILVSTFMQTGDWFLRSVELKGGTLISFQTTQPVDAPALTTLLEKEFSTSITAREIRGSAGYTVTMEMDAAVNETAVTARIRELATPVGISVQKTGPALGETFWVQTQIGFVLAFVLMSVVVFIVYRVPVPSFLVIITVFADIITVMALMLLFRIELTLATFASLLMLVGYSVDTDILQTTRFLKGGGGSGSDVMKGSIKTGVTMTATTIVAMVAVVVSSLSPVISQIAMVLLIGLVVDIVYTYAQNAVLLRWYTEKKGLVS